MSPGMSSEALLSGRWTVYSGRRLNRSSGESAECLSEALAKGNAKLTQ